MKTVKWHFLDTGGYTSGNSRHLFSWESGRGINSRAFIQDTRKSPVYVCVYMCMYIHVLTYCENADLMEG